MKRYNHTWVTGSKYVKRYSLKKHVIGETHILLLDLEKKELGPAVYNKHIAENTHIDRGLVEMVHNLETLRVCFHNAYYLVPNERPFERLLHHYQPTPTKKWCPTIYIYLNDRAATNFTDVVNEMPKNDPSDQVRKCKYISRLGDGSTDAAITEEELTYLLFTIEQGKPGAKFLSIESIEYTTAEDLKDAIKIVLSRVRTIFQTDSM